ncbi:MAG: diguanylate cyclase, partial [Anaerolineae bacterium]|nr:diguanylate cyclase [Anaerolineae bacterium]NIO00509.1 diguanylate cyclase [Anaerolineae bacterium]
MDQRNDSVSNLGLVLIADDDDDFRRLLVRRAKRMGLRVVEARDGCEALEAVKRQSFDALVLDLYMPGASGIEVLEAGSRIDPEVQTILLTGNASLETAVEALRAGAYDYLTKPLDSLTVFELALTRALEHRHLLQDNARLFAEVQRLAVTDPLTGLYNRHKLNEALAAEVERAQRYGRPLALIMLDLDNLKRVNDSLGHPAGDEVLKQVADIIRQEIRRVDIATRFGGDEFLV